MSDLSPAERSRLSQLEDVIERGVKSFVEVGEALMEVRDSHLYRDTHETFEAYCRDRYQMERAHAYRLIQSADVAHVLSPTGDIPRTERQMRELAPLLPVPETMRDVWDASVAKYKDPTSEQIREVINTRHPALIAVDPEVEQQKRRRHLIDELDRAVTAMESPPSIAIDEIRMVLLGGSAGPFTAERFERVALYAQTCARELRRLEVVA